MVKITYLRNNGSNNKKQRKNCKDIREDWKKTRHHSVMLNDLLLHPLKIQIVQTLNPWLLKDDPQLIHNIWIRDEPHCHVNGYVSKLNFCMGPLNNFTHGISIRYILVCDILEWSNRFIHILETFLIPEFQRCPVNKPECVNEPSERPFPEPPHQ